MSHSTPLKTDPGINQDLLIRRSRNATIIFRHLDSAGDPYLITDDFRFIVKQRDGDSEEDALIDISTDDDVVIDENEIQVPLTEELSNLDHFKGYYELINTTTGQNWYQGNIEIMRGKVPVYTTATEVEATINLGETVIETTITIAGINPEEITEDQAYELWQNYFSKFSVGQTPPL